MHNMKRDKAPPTKERSPAATLRLTGRLAFKKCIHISHHRGRKAANNSSRHARAAYAAGFAGCQPVYTHLDLPSRSLDRARRIEHTTIGKAQPGRRISFELVCQV